jgi:4-amino-4-deoxy-L-arabinose transferase-like glycosyltransferase
MEDPGDLEPVPWKAVGLVSGAAVVLLLLVSTRYGWHRDELYFLESGKDHLSWGYVDQPPFTPFVARLADAVAPGNLAVLRLLPALTTGVSILLGTLIARELGGRKCSQIAGAGAVAAGGFTLGVGHLLSTAAFDMTAWLALLWLTARLLRTRDPRWWVAFGGIAGVALLNKHLVVLLALTVVAALVVERRWELLGSRWLVVGGALALAIGAPNLIWQAQHDWPQLDMAQALSDRLAGENRSTLVPLQLLYSGPVLLPILWAGARWLGRDDAGRTFRALLWAWPIGLVVAFATAGRPYYVLPLTTTVLLAGCVAFERADRVMLMRLLIVPNAIVSAFLSLPLLPVSAVGVTGAVNEAVAETVGWPELVDQVADVVHGLPADEQDRVVLLAGTYGEAGALDRFGPARGLPRAYSPHNGYADFGHPSVDDATVVAVRAGHLDLERHFDSCAVVGRVDNGHDIDNEAQGQPIQVCHGLRGTWRDVWDDLRFLS